MRNFEIPAFLIGLLALLLCNQTVHGQNLDLGLTEKIDSIILLANSSESEENREKYFKLLKKTCYAAKPYINKLRSYQWALSRFDHDANVQLFGFIYSEMGGLYDDPGIYNMDSSKYYLDTVLVFIDELDPYVQLNNYNNLTATYKFLQIWEDATVFCFRGIEIAEKRNDIYFLKNLYYNVASLTVKRTHDKESEKVVEYLDKSVALAIAEGDSVSIANYYYRYANKIAKIGMNEKAFAVLDSCEKYVQYPSVINTNKGQVVYVSLLLTRGVLNTKLGNLIEGEKDLLLALEVSDKNNFKERQKEIPFHLAKIYIAQKDYEKVINTLDKVMFENASNLNLSDYESGNLLLSSAHDSLGRDEEALSYLKKWMTVSDSIQNINDLTVIAGLENKYKNNEQKKEIAFQQDMIAQQIQQRKYLIGFLTALSLLSLGLFAVYRKVRSAKNEINKQKNIIAISLEEKEILLKEVHHRVKNNLQVMSGLLQIQSNNSDNEELKQILHQSRNRIYSIAIIHELLYQDKEIREISADEYLLKILEQNDAIQERKAELVVGAKNIALSMDQAIPLGLMLNELAINSYKHGFDDGRAGKIEVVLEELRTNDKSYRFTYRDNGKGIPADLDISKTKSLGLRLIKMMCRQLRSSFEIRKAKGTEIVMRF